MTVSLSKRADGSGVLRVVRDDGTATWQKQNDRLAPFFALHDLTHFAVESVLGCKRGFFGLIAEGWEIDDTTGKGTRGSLPPEAGEVEHFVNIFSVPGGSMLNADEFNEAAGQARKLTEDEIAQVRKRRSELFRQWTEVPAGQTMELKFPG